MNSLVFKRVTAQSEQSDRESLCHIVKTTFVDAFGMNYTPEDLEGYINERLTPGMIEEELNDSHSYFYQVISDDVLLGYVKWIVSCDKFLNNVSDSLRKPYQDPVFLERFYFTADSQGTGVADITMQCVMSQARNFHKKNSIYLSVWEHNHRAQSFYQKYGFRTIGSCEYIVGTKVDHEYLYGRLL